MFSQMITRFLVACVLSVLSFQMAVAQQLATLNPNGSNMSVAEFAGHTWRATSSGGGGTHRADLDFAIQGGKLVGKTIHWPGSGKTSKLVVESVSSKRLVATTVVKQACGKSRKITYAISFRKKSIGLNVTGPKSRCRSGTFKETGSLTRK